MTDLRKAAEMAIDAMISDDVHKRAVAIVELRQAIAQPQPVQFKCTVVDDGHPNGVPLSQWGRQPEHEPVAWILNRELFWHSEYQSIAEPNDGASPLYIAPPKREWVGLTDEEILDEYRQCYGDDGTLTDCYFARAIIIRFKEKNGS